MFMISVSVIWCNIEALKKKALQNDHEVLQIVKIFGRPFLPYSFFQIDCSVIKTVFEISNSIHNTLII